jgi:hypothetical protein
MRGYHTWGVFSVTPIEPTRIRHRPRYRYDLHSHHKSEAEAQKSANYIQGYEYTKRFVVRRINSVGKFYRYGLEVNT